MTLHEKHILRIELVNESKTQDEHDHALTSLRHWRQGVEDAGLRIDLCAADFHYLNQGIDRPMCCGVWLDWEPTRNPSPPTP